MKDRGSLEPEEVDAYLGEINAYSIRDYSVETRNIVRALEEKISRLENMVLTGNQTIAGLQQQVGMLLARHLGGGPTDGN